MTSGVMRLDGSERYSSVRGPRRRPYDNVSACCSVQSLSVRCVFACVIFGPFMA